MSLPSNNSRPITIDSIPCRWTVAGNKKDSTLIILVQGENGGKLSVSVHQEIEGWAWLYNSKGKSYHGPITSNWIQEIAKMAMNNGWHPTKTDSISCKFDTGNLVINN